MNKYILLVMKWLDDKNSVSQEELVENRNAAAAATDAAYTAAAADTAAAEKWVNEYFNRTGENKQEYLDPIAKGKKVELPEEEMKPEIKPDSRINIIGQNGNDGEHYEELERNKSKYHREIKSGVFVDVYDVLLAFGVTNPAMQHALKKMLAPGQRGVKDTIQDMKEAIQSIERAIELEQS